MTVEFALRLAGAAGRVLAPGGGRVLVGKDTRLSGYMFEAALEAGFVAAGVDVLLAGPLPTPGIAYLVQRLGCDFGAVISASHNRFDDNGIKFFDREGSKLADELEEAIESHLDEPAPTLESAKLGRATRVDRERTLYQTFCASTLPSGMRLDGLKLVIDCANGAAYKVAPRVLTDLGAEIIPIGCSPNGRNINDGCGSTEPGLLKLTVAGVRADAGIALDGDGDRLVMVDHLGRTVDGDQLLYVLTKARLAAGDLQGPGRRHRHEQSRARTRAEGTRRPVHARGRRRPQRPADAARKWRRAGRRGLGAPPGPRQGDDRRRSDRRAAGARRHEGDGQVARRARHGHAALSAAAHQCPRREAL